MDGVVTLDFPVAGVRCVIEFPLAPSTAAGVETRMAAGAVACGAVAGAAGRYDDTAGAAVESAGDKGFAGHVRALLP